MKPYKIITSAMLILTIMLSWTTVTAGDLTVEGSLSITTNLTVQGTISGDGSGLTGIEASDNMGNHIATTNLNMAGFTIINAVYFGDGANLTGITGGDPSYGSSVGSPNTVVFVDDNGNVGIATNNPQVKLHIAGDIIIGKGNTITDYAISTGAFAQGANCNVSGVSSHAEGIGTTASDLASHAEGADTTAGGYYGSHAEGYGTTANGTYGSHAEGYFTTANGYSSHAEGDSTTANGHSSHAEGYFTTASGEGSHAGGVRAYADHDNSFVWSSSDDYWNKDVHSSTSHQFTVYAKNGICLLGGTTFISRLEFEPSGDLLMGSYTNRPSL